MRRNQLARRRWMYTNAAGALLFGLLFFQSVAWAAQGDQRTSDQPATSSAKGAEVADAVSGEDPETRFGIEQDTLAWTARALFFGLGLATGATVGGVLLFGPPAPGEGGFYKSGAHPAVAFLSAALSTTVFAGVGALGLLAFAEAMLRFPGSDWWSLILGPLAGTAAAAFIGAVGFSSIVLFAVPLGVMDENERLTYLGAVGMGLWSGAFWGAFFGPLPGLVLGPAVRFVVGGVGRSE